MCVVYTLIIKLKFNLPLIMHVFLLNHMGMVILLKTLSLSLSLPPSLPSPFPTHPRAQ